MREILFRGKRDNGDWCFGNLFIPDKKDAPTEICIGTNVIRITYDVIPETVGQYTGLTDENGKKIFDGDIVQYYGTYPLEVFIEKGHTKIRWYDTATKSQCAERFFGEDVEAYGECEIIGNIHDNPELLKGGAE